MRPRIAVVQSRKNPDGIAREQHNISNTVGDLAELVFLSSLDDSLAWNDPAKLLEGYKGIYFGGSSDFDFHGSHDPKDEPRAMAHDILYRLENLIKYAFAHNVPVLGICFGHQLIGHTFGQECVNDKEQSKYGTHEVTLTEAGKEDELLKNLPEKFMAQYAHKDSLTGLPTGATLLAESPVCKYGALRYGPGEYTFQFHPEVEKFEDPFPHQPSPEASKIIPLWIREFGHNREDSPAVPDLEGVA